MLFTLVPNAEVQSDSFSYPSIYRSNPAIHYLSSLVSRLIIKMFFDIFDNQLFAVVFIA